MNFQFLPFQNNFQHNKLAMLDPDFFLVYCQLLYHKHTNYTFSKCDVVYYISIATKNSQNFCHFAYLDYMSEQFLKSRMQLKIHVSQVIKLTAALDSMEIKVLGCQREYLLRNDCKMIWILEILNQYPSHRRSVASFAHALHRTTMWYGWSINSPVLIWLL